MILDGRNHTIEHTYLIGCTNERAFRAASIIAAYINDEGIIKLAKLLNGVYDTAYFMVGVSKISGIHLRLAGK